MIQKLETPVVPYPCRVRGSRDWYTVQACLHRGGTPHSFYRYLVEACLHATAEELSSLKTNETFAKAWAIWEAAGRQLQFKDDLERTSDKYENARQKQMREREQAEAIEQREEQRRLRQH